MELYAGAALTGMGYLLNQQRAPETLNSARDPKETPSMGNMYSSDYWRTVKEDEQQRGNRLYQDAKDPWNTGVVSRPAYASMFASVAPTERSAQDGSQLVQSLTGETVRREEFTHNNMQPFFRGHVKQNMNPNANTSLLESHTGRGDLLLNKKEVECLFQPTAGLTNICGMQNNDDYYLSHIQAPVARRNDFPIAQIQVGPGLGKGFSANPTGGFQQSETLDYIRPKTVDELRVLTKPKTVFESRPQGPQKGINQRGMLGEVAKHRPDTFYEQSPEQWLKTTGAVTKETTRSVQNVKPTARVTSHIEYQGIAGNTQPGRGESDDYGKAAIVVYDNERMTTETKTVVSNVTSVVKAIVAPFVDILRHNTKEYTTDASRTFGNMHAQIPSKATLYDPVNHMMRTTIKETTIHDTTINNLKGPEQGRAEDLAPAKTTVRETLPVEDTVRNVTAHTYKVIVYNPDEVAKTTIRETTGIPADEFGFVGGDVNKAVGAYSHIDVHMPNTQRQFISDNDHYGTGVSTSDFRPVSDEAERNAEIDGTREAMNVAAGYTPNAGGGYTSLEPDLVEVESKKTDTDIVAPRSVGNVTRVQQATAKANVPCELTRGGPVLPNANEDRLDAAVLNSLKTNPYNLSINPIGTM